MKTDTKLLSTLIMLQNVPSLEHKVNTQCAIFEE